MLGADPTQPDCGLFLRARLRDQNDGMLPIQDRAGIRRIAPPEGDVDGSSHVQAGELVRLANIRDLRPRIPQPQDLLQPNGFEGSGKGLFQGRPSFRFMIASWEKYGGASG